MENIKTYKECKSKLAKVFKDAYEKTEMLRLTSSPIMATQLKDEKFVLRHTYLAYSDYMLQNLYGCIYEISLDLLKYFECNSNELEYAKRVKEEYDNEGWWSISLEENLESKQKKEYADEDLVKNFGIEDSLYMCLDSCDGGSDSMSFMDVSYFKIYGSDDLIALLQEMKEMATLANDLDLALKQRIKIVVSFLDKWFVDVE
ncbi:hypothetical protein KMW28_27055 [Flammeovirga yaeyamensis]|uniref:Uncharacterized protein n=1 Tax=Flammeovirga yaeyamensis TaxID=367791 RepID=A0AAX1NAG8_9BACT|nr:hypothetical protein [Flammeovirga yaeyamensis]MBB3700063.1 hypothetical protein [Flammeovirga yaeyamensis]NMF37502.1 hypothetical protein [Flammeovirga yaeyamensis]QWG04559.1 hypothetical protein KMW28_27055 [Flammeovirga yaeyamensis]